MNIFQPELGLPARVLATDLDGTLIPLPGLRSNLASLDELKRRLNETGRTLVFATGREFGSIVRAIHDYRLPQPDWIVSDIGTGVRHRVDGKYEPHPDYPSVLVEATGGYPRDELEAQFAHLGELQLQAEHAQSAYKLSYFCPLEELDGILSEMEEVVAEEQLPYEVMASVDHNRETGMIDVLPRGVTKASALIWLSTHADFHPEEVLYAGDSGNDFAALVSGFRAVIMGNATEGLAGKVEAAMLENGLRERLLLSDRQATDAVLHGCLHFGLFD